MTNRARVCNLLIFCGAVLVGFPALGQTVILDNRTIESPTSGLNLGPGSTPEGDKLRGEAAKEIGEGINALYSAQGRSTDANTLIRLSEYQYRYLERINRAREKQFGRRFNRMIVTYNQRQDRLRNDPDYLDLLRGDTLNVVLQDLFDPKIAPSSLRLVSVELPVSTVQTLPFQVPTLSGSISRRTLTVDNGNGWPVALNVKELEREKNAYLRAVDAFLERNLQPNLPLNSVLAVESAVADLKSSVQLHFVMKNDVYNQAMNFVRQLEDQARLLKNDTVRRFLADIEKYSGTTIADLIDFMRWYHLRFAAAEPGTPERSLYPTLYERLNLQREKIQEMARQDAADARSRSAKPGSGKALDQQDSGNRPDKGDQ